MWTIPLIGIVIGAVGLFVLSFLLPALWFGLLAIFLALLCSGLYFYTPDRALVFAIASDDCLPDELFAKARHTGDDLADSVLALLGPTSIYKSDNILALVAEHASNGHSDAKAFLDSFFDRTNSMPAWIDQEQAKRGQQFLIQWLDVALGTGLGAIIESYAYQPGAKILVMTGRLAGEQPSVARRLLETGEFYIDVVEYGIGVDSKALNTIAKVRLLHAMVRKHVRTQEWDTATWGVPVSQEDMAHTVTLFSHVYTRGIEASGLPMTSAQKNDLSMFWSCVGYMLGVEESLLARSYEHELQLYAGFVARNFKPDADTVALVNATLNGAAGLPPFRFQPPQLAAISRFTLGDKVADACHVPRTQRLADWALLFAFSITITARWLLFRIVPWRRNYVPTARRDLQDGLLMYASARAKKTGVDGANYRLVLERRKKIKQ